MALPLEASSEQLEKRLSVARILFPKTESDDARPMASFMPQVNVEGSFRDRMSAHVWRNREIWRAGASVLTNKRIPAL